jgi:hippurate hydrolase
MSALILVFLQCALLLTNPVAASGRDESDVHKRIKEMISSEYPSLEILYRHLHAHPELSLQEEKTSRRLAEELEQAGFQVTRNVGGYGIVGIMKNGEGSTIMVRTDMDALPVEEKTGLSYASRIRAKDSDGNDVFVMHACGHDIHMTTFIGTARLLARLRNNWTGTLIMVGQPAEEGGGGADAMIADGLFDRFPRPDFALAWHVSPSLPAGKVAYCKGHAFASVDSVDVSIRGVGGHGATPHSTKDPTVLAAQFILALQTIVSRETAPTEPAVVSVGSIHGGTKHNIIPDEINLQLTVRSYSEETRERILSAIKRIAKGIALAGGIPEDRLPMVLVKSGNTKSTYNDPELTERAVGAFRSILGPENVVSTGPVMIGEDFGHYGKTKDGIPISLLWLGSVDPSLYEESVQTGRTLPPLHSPHFAPLPDLTIKTGVKAMTAAVLELFRKKQ